MRTRNHQVVWGGDRGTITNAHILDELKAKEGLDWITALTKSQIRQLAEVDQIQLGLFDEKEVIEINSEDYPGERLIACRNPLMAQKNALVREELLLSTEKELEKIKQATQREKRALQGADAIGLRVGKVINKFKVGKLFEIEITESNFSYRRKTEEIAREKILDGVDIIRTSVEPEKMDTATTVRAYKGLSKVEQAFRCLKTQENLPVHSFSTLLLDLATIAQNQIQINLPGERVTFEKITQPTALQQKALDLLGVSLICTQ